MKKVTAVAGQVGIQMRDRMRSVKRRMLENARASRDLSEKGKQKRALAYGKLLDVTGRVAGQAWKVSSQIASKGTRVPRQVLQKAQRQLDEMIPRVEQVMRQAGERALSDDSRWDGKIARAL